MHRLRTTSRRGLTIAGQILLPAAAQLLKVANEYAVKPAIDRVMREVGKIHHV